MLESQAFGRSQPNSQREPSPLSLAEIHGFMPEAGAKTQPQRIQLAAGEPIILPGDTRRPAPEYPGGIGPDWKEAKSVINAGVPYGRYLTDLFERTYTTRAGENQMPASLTLNEVPPEIKAKIDPSKWLLLGDSDLYTKRPEYGNRDLKVASDFQPGSTKNPGHLYAFARDKDNNPVAMFEYYRDPLGNIHYDRQLQINYQRGELTDKQGNKQPYYKIDVNEYKAQGQTADAGPRVVINGLPHTNTGRTTYYERMDMTFAKAERYDGWDMSSPRLTLDFVRAEVNTRNAAGIVKTEQLRSDQDALIKIRALSRQFHFFNLYGPFDK